MEHCLTMYLVVKFCISEVRLSKHWNGSTTASTWWIQRINPFYIFGGSEICRLPYIHLLQNNSPLWIEARTAYKWVINVRTRLYAVCLSFLHFRQSFISVAVCIFKYRHWKGKGFRGEYSPQEEDSDRNGLPPRPFNFQMKSVLPLQTSNRNGWMAESGES